MYTTNFCVSYTHEYIQLTTEVTTVNTHVAMDTPCLTTMPPAAPRTTPTPAPSIITMTVMKAAMKIRMAQKMSRPTTTVALNVVRIDFLPQEGYLSLNSMPLNRPIHAPVQSHSTTPLNPTRKLLMVMGAKRVDSGHIGQVQQYASLICLIYMHRRRHHHLAYHLHRGCRKVPLSYVTHLTGHSRARVRSLMAA